MAVSSTSPAPRSKMNFDWTPAALPDCSIARMQEIRSMSALGLGKTSGVDWETVHALSCDPLTGLPMARLFEARIDHLLSKTENEFAIVIINCQKFRLVNELYGREVANGVLKTIAKRFKKLDQPSVFCARLRDDRFGFIVSKAHRALAEEFFAALETTLSKPMRFRGHRYQLGFAVGINWRQAGETPRAHELLLDAETSLQHAKNRTAENFVSVFERPLIHQHAELRIQQQLIEQLGNQTLPIYINPVINLRTGNIYSYQAVPMLFDNGEAIPFDIVMKVAEGCGMMLPLTEYIISHGIKQYAKVEQRLNTYFCVKVGRVDMCNTRLTQLAVDRLAEFDVPEYKFQLELHDEVRADDWRSLIDEMFELERAECASHFKRQAFGRNVLKFENGEAANLQVNKVFWLKRCVLQKALDNDRDLHLLRTTIDLARSLGVDVMANDLHDESHRSLALSLGILFGKGPLVGENAPLSVLR